MPNAAPILLRAAWVAPMERPVIRDGGVLFAGGRVAAVGSSRELARDVPASAVHDYGDAVILPGLVNAHTHLELSLTPCGERPASFERWVLSLPGRIGPERDFAAAARAGARQSLRFGVTTVGDISQHPHLTRPALRDGPLRCVSFGEVLGVGPRRWRIDELLPRAIDRQHESSTLRTGVSPHAPYSLELPDFRRCIAAARDNGLPLATHLAELPHERRFLEEHAGPLREMLDLIGAWDESVQTYRGGPIAFARDIGLLDLPAAILAHVNYCDDAELHMLAAGRASVVYCPRTHDYFGHAPHRWREMLARGINVAIGTDSCASSPDLDLVAELRHVRAGASDVPAATLWERVTIAGARALGMGDEAGALEPGCHADAVVFPAQGLDPLAAVLVQPVPLLAVWSGGELVETCASGDPHPPLLCTQGRGQG